MNTVAFDVDGTLVKEKSSWLTVHRYFGTLNDACKNLILYNNHQIDYPTFMRKDIELWGKSIDEKKIHQILDGFTLHSKARYVIQKLKSRGFTILLISAGIDILVEKVASDLKINHYVSNGLATDEKGYLTGEGVFRVDLWRKDKALKNILECINLEPKDCIAVGDSKYDAEFLKQSGVGVALGNNVELKKYAKYSISDLPEILCII